jgi:hypothetical protein
LSEVWLLLSDAALLALAAILLFERSRRQTLEKDMAAHRQQMAARLENTISVGRTEFDVLKEEFRQYRARLTEAQSEVRKLRGESGENPESNQQLQKKIQSISEELKAELATRVDSQIDTIQTRTVEQLAKRNEAADSLNRVAFKEKLHAIEQKLADMQALNEKKYTEIVELLCYCQFMTLVDDQRARATAAIDFILEHSDEMKIIELADKSSVPGLIQILELLKDRKVSQKQYIKLVEATLAKFDDTTGQTKDEDAQRLSFQLLDLARASDVAPFELLPLLPRIAPQSVKNNNEALAEDLHKLAVRCIADCRVAIEPLLLTKVMQMYRSLSRGNEELLRKRAREFEQAIKNEQAYSIENRIRLAEVFAAQSLIEASHQILMDTAGQIASPEVAVSETLSKSMLGTINLLGSKGYLPLAGEASCQLLDAFKARGLSAEAEEVLQTLGMVASSFAEKGDFSQAESIYKRRLQYLQETKAGKKRILEGLKELSALYLKSNRIDELADLQEHVLSITKDLYGDSSGELIEAINSAADIFAKAKQFDKSKALLKEGVLVASRVWGESGTRTINLLSSLAELYIRQQRYADAEILFRKMLEQHQKRSPNPSLALGEIYTKLGDSLSLQKNYQAAEGNYQLAIENIEAAAGQDHHDTLLPLGHLANLYMMTGKYKEAERCYKRVLEIRYKTSGEDSDETVNSLLRLADLYDLQSEFAESEVFLESAMETAVKIYPEQDVRLAEVMQQYAKLLKRLGRTEEVAKLEARAEAIKAGLTTGQYYTVDVESLHRPDDEKQKVK